MTTPVEIIANPLTMVYGALFKMLEQQPRFTELVKLKNRIDFGTTNRDPLKRNISAADTPEVMLMPNGGVSNLNSTSSSTMFTKQYSWMISTGDFSVDSYLHQVEWEIIRGMLSWKQVLGALKWKSKSFVKRAGIVEIAEGITDPELNRGLPGWSSIWSVEVEMHIKTTDINPDAFA